MATLRGRIASHKLSPLVFLVTMTYKVMSYHAKETFVYFFYFFLLYTEIITNAGGQLNEFPAAPGLSMGAGNRSEAESEFSSLPTFRNSSG